MIMYAHYTLNDMYEAIFYVIGVTWGRVHRMLCMHDLRGPTAPERKSMHTYVECAYIRYTLTLVTHCVTSHLLYNLSLDPMQMLKCYIIEEMVIQLYHLM